MSARDDVYGLPGRTTEVGWNLTSVSRVTINQRGEDETVLLRKL
jgi:hypothetical protein